MRYGICVMTHIRVATSIASVQALCIMNVITHITTATACIGTTMRNVGKFMCMISTCFHLRRSRNHNTRRTHSGSEYGDHHFADVRFFHSKLPRLLSSFVVDTSVAGVRGCHENCVCTRIRITSSEILLGICLSIVYKIPSLFVNIQIHQNTASAIMHISQTQYFERHYIHTCLSAKTPCSIP